MRITQNTDSRRGIKCPACPGIRTPWCGPWIVAGRRVGLAVHEKGPLIAERASRVPVRGSKVWSEEGLGITHIRRAGRIRTFDVRRSEVDEGPQLPNGLWGVTQNQLPHGVENGCDWRDEVGI